ncbi:MAG: hypothetical protein HC851_21525 [Acaryochloris sp. RU_4_1]|nr:hypothetical protein [Acaryochloris sp. RU_4_1]NJR56621.1 hypothetical protein [Acaryochloris sp. CRU_2_0]
MKISKQYPVSSLNGKRFTALRDYFGDDLERHMVQAMWAVLGPLGSALAELPEKEIQAHLTSSKLLVKGFHQEASDLIGGGEVSLDVPQEDSPTAFGEPISSAITADQSGDPLNNLF